MALDTQRRLTLTLIITSSIFLVEAAGGYISNSLALLSDAGHVFTDAFALALSLLAFRISRRPSGIRATFGYQRVGILAAVVNGLSLLGIAVLIFIESYRRFVQPSVIDLDVMLPVAVLGLVANLVMVAILGHGHKDLNIKSAWLHVLGDTLSSVGVIISGIIVYFTGWPYADPVAGFLIGGIIITGGFRVVREALTVFLEFVPSGYNVEEIAKTIADMPEVMGIHDIHVWSLTHGRVAFSARVWVHDQKLSEAEAVKMKINDRLKEMGIEHIIIQLECGECEANGLYCQIHAKEEEHEGHKQGHRPIF